MNKVKFLHQISLTKTYVVGTRKKNRLDGMVLVIMQNVFHNQVPISHSFESIPKLKS